MLSSGGSSTNPKNEFRNMMNDGLAQSGRLIIDRPYKNGRLTKWSAPAGEELVVISYEILTAKINKTSLSAKQIAE